MARLPTLLVALLTASTAVGQDAPRNLIELRFLASHHSITSAGDLQLRADKWQSKPFTVPSNHLSDPLAVPARTLALTTPGDDPAKARQLCQIKLPEPGKRFVAVLVPMAQQLVPHVLRVDDSSFRAGDVFLHNATATQVGGKLGTTGFSLNPGAGRICRPNHPADARFFEVALFHLQDGSTRPLSTTRWPVDNNARGYVLFFTDPTSGRIEYRAVDEWVPPAPPPR